MIDRRGHRKLRLTSRKHFKPKPKRLQTRAVPVNETPCPQANELPSPQEELTSLKISLPVSSYMDSPLRRIDELLGRLKKQRNIPPGMDNVMG